MSESKIEVKEVRLVFLEEKKNLHGDCECDVIIKLSDGRMWGLHKMLIDPQLIEAGGLKFLKEELQTGIDIAFETLKEEIKKEERESLFFEKKWREIIENERKAEEERKAILCDCPHPYTGQHIPCRYRHPEGGTHICLKKRDSLT